MKPERLEFNIHNLPLNQIVYAYMGDKLVGILKDKFNIQVFGLEDFVIDNQEDYLKFIDMAHELKYKKDKQTGLRIEDFVLAAKTSSKGKWYIGGWFRIGPPW